MLEATLYAPTRNTSADFDTNHGHCAGGGFRCRERYRSALHSYFCSAHRSPTRVKRAAAVQAAYAILIRLYPAQSDMLISSGRHR